MLIPPLSARLREGTRESHRLAESTPFIRTLFAGKLSMESYRLFLAQLLHIYTALEHNQAGLSQHPVFGKIYFSQLFRAEKLVQDLTHYFGDTSWQAAQPLPATLEYVQRINHLGLHDVESLVAHHYTRYLGDLSGGQAIKRIVMKMFPEHNGAGLAFYEFPEIGDHNAFKDDYRAGLDAMPLDEAAAQKIVDEANHAFALNRRVFAAMMETVVV